MDFTGLVWKQEHFLVWNRVRIWKTGRHTPTKNSQEYPPGFLECFYLTGEIDGRLIRGITL